jgi:hypothetical protein
MSAFIFADKISPGMGRKRQFGDDSIVSVPTKIFAAKRPFALRTSLYRLLRSRLLFQYLVSDWH